MHTIFRSSLVFRNTHTFCSRIGVVILLTNLNAKFCAILAFDCLVVSYNIWFITPKHRFGSISMVWRSFNVKRFSNRKKINIFAHLSRSGCCCCSLLRPFVCVCVILSKQQHIGFIFRSGWSPFAIWAHWRRQFNIKFLYLFVPWLLTIFRCLSRMSAWTRYQEYSIRVAKYQLESYRFLISTTDNEGNFYWIFNGSTRFTRKPKRRDDSAVFDSSCILLLLFLCILMVYIGVNCFWRTHSCVNRRIHLANEMV